MAKKDPTDLTVEEKLKTLFQLQTTLSGIDEKRALRGELPLEVQDLEDEIAGLSALLSSHKKSIVFGIPYILKRKKHLKKNQEHLSKPEAMLIL